MHDDAIVFTWKVEATAQLEELGEMAPKALDRAMAELRYEATHECVRGVR